MAAKGQPKPCDHCGTEVFIRYRIQHDERHQWVLVCPGCWEKLSQGNSYYRYGGTWKAR